MRNRTFLWCMLVTAGMTLATATHVSAHGDVTPQPVNTKGLPPLKKGLWLTENPYKSDPKVLARAVEIGASGYNQNCARCHGLQVISGGLAPDLRHLEKGQVGDEWFIERIRHGSKKPDGATNMPAFETVFNQEAMWAIRSYIESVHED